MDWDSCFGCVEVQPIILEIGNLEQGSIPYPQARVPKGKHECPLPRRVCFRNDVLDFRFREGRPGKELHLRWFERRRRIPFEPFILHAEPEKRTEPFEMLRGGSGRERPAVPEIPREFGAEVG